ncbi:hypothetical protein QQP08_008446 [Theobroma cacao]|nr:hypothetical protein QQP08_008446 [Theobroma cacao]
MRNNNIKAKSDQVPSGHDNWPKSEFWLSGKDPPVRVWEQHCSSTHRCIQVLQVIQQWVYHRATAQAPSCGQDWSGGAGSSCFPGLPLCIRRVCP